jgi:8-oxo-dGTP diphosphatase
MKLLKIIQKKDLSAQEIAGFRVRQAARAVVLDENKNIGLLYVSRYKFHKLPGGGLENDEGPLEALHRECLEEIGCQIEVLGELGEIIEYRDKYNLQQQSFSYVAKVVGAKGTPDFTLKEINNGFRIEWVSLDEALKLLESENPQSYEGSFINIRDSLILQEALRFLDKLK